MPLVLTPGRVPSKADKPGAGGFKIYLTDEKGGWVVIGGRGKAGNPFDLKSQKNLGYDTEEEAWAFIDQMRTERPEIFDQPLRSHKLYYDTPTYPTFIREHSRPVK